MNEAANIIHEFSGIGFLFRGRFNFTIFPIACPREGSMITFALMKLFYREYGAGQPVVILHGIFGSSDNWLTQAKILADKYRVILVDLRNHGQSPKDDAFDYQVMVADVEELFDSLKLQDPILIGHSMGGKVAMNFAIRHPDLLSRLVVVDISPRPYNLEHYVILDGLNAISIDTVSSRNEADQTLVPFVPEADVRQFLLKNLQRKPEGGFSWKINLPVITKNLPKIGYDLQFQGSFDKPALFIRGGKSKYVRDEDMARIQELFPLAQLRTMDTGHWVQAEKPQEFVDVLLDWLQNS